MLCYGSHALPWRENPTDVDLICTVDEINMLVERARRLGILEHAAPLNRQKYVLVAGGVIHEIEIAHVGGTAERLENLCKMYPTILLSDRAVNSPILRLNEVPIISLETAFALKMSHRFLKNSPHFEKTRRDIMNLRELGYEQVHHLLEDWYAERERETYDYGHPSLKMSKAQFFDTPGVEYKYDHDSIHKAVAIEMEPAYTRFIADGEEVQCSREKFEALPFDVQLNAVMEESMVLALERCLVPFNFETNPKAAYKMALQKVCTSITSGWFREFAWEHYEEALNNFPENYVECFMDGLYSGTIKHHEDV